LCPPRAPSNRYADDFSPPPLPRLNLRNYCGEGNPSPPSPVSLVARFCPSAATSGGVTFLSHLVERRHEVSATFSQVQYTNSSMCKQAREEFFSAACSCGEAELVFARGGATYEF
jgi:hypothetical protein